MPQGKSQQKVPALLFCQTKKAKYHAKFGDSGGKKLRPTQTLGSSDMNKKILLLPLFILCITISAQAQKPGTVKSFEEAYGRTVEPLHNAYGIPIVYDVVLGQREEFGPYKFPIKGDLHENELQNYKNRAIYMAMLEKDADELIGSIFDSYILDDDPKTLWVRLSAYPAHWRNFRNLNADSKEIEMIKVIYPSAVDAYGKYQEERRKMGAAK